MTGCVGLHRDSLEQWERKSFPKLGFSVYLPKECEVYANNVRNYNFNKSLSIWIHYYSSGLLIENTHVISIKMIVASKDDIKKYMNKELSFFYGATGIGTIHYSLTEYDIDSKVPLFRRDYPTKDGGAILCGAFFHKSAVKNSDDSEFDIKAIKHILNSVRILGTKEK